MTVAIAHGLAGFITGAYDASERAGKHVILIKLLPHVALEEGFAEDAELVLRADALRQKFIEILRTAS
jgi:hypothetical protein